MSDRITSANRQPGLIVGALAVVLVSAGFVQGRFSGTVDSSQRLEDAIGRLNRLPSQCGRWKAKELETNPEELSIAGADGALLRRYTNSATGRSATVLLLCGRPGPIAVHPPTACYRARGYRLNGEPGRIGVTVDGGRQEFLAAEFANTSGYAHDRVGILWGWSANGDWSVPDVPRMAFAGEAVLFKLYVTWDRADSSRPFDETVPREFCQAFLKCLNQADVPIGGGSTTP